MSKNSGCLDRVRAAFILTGAGAASLLAAMAMSLTSGPAAALPAFSQQTSKPCGFCHTAPAGGKELNAAGKKFKAKGNKL